MEEDKGKPENEAPEVKPEPEWIRKTRLMWKSYGAYSHSAISKGVDSFLRLASSNYGRMKARQDAVRKIMGIK